MSLLGIAQFLLEHYVSYNHFPRIPPFADVLGGWDQSSSFYYLFFSVSHHITAENKVYGIILSRMYVLPPRTRLSRVTTVPVWTLVSEKCGLPSNPVCYHSTKMSTGHLFLKGLALLYFLMFFFTMPVKGRTKHVRSISLLCFLPCRREKTSQEIRNSRIFFAVSTERKNEKKNGGEM